MPFRYLFVFGSTEPDTSEQRQHATILQMPTDHILSLLIQEKDKIDRAIAALQGTRAGTARRTTKHTESADTTTAPAPNHTRKRRWTLAMKRAAAERAKAVWAKKRKAAKKG
jgi:hypothetical protein